MNRGKKSPKPKTSGIIIYNNNILKKNSSVYYMICMYNNI